MLTAQRARGDKQPRGRESRSNSNSALALAPRACARRVALAATAPRCQKHERQLRAGSVVVVEEIQKRAKARIAKAVGSTQPEQEPILHTKRFMGAADRDSRLGKHP